MSNQPKEVSPLGAEDAAYAFLAFYGGWIGKEIPTPIEENIRRDARKLVALCTPAGNVPRPSFVARVLRDEAYHKTVARPKFYDYTRAATELYALADALDRQIIPALDTSNANTTAALLRRAALWLQTPDRAEMTLKADILALADALDAQDVGRGGVCPSHGLKASSLAPARLPLPLPAIYRGNKMGDHRANVKITFEAHGITRKLDISINWSPDGNGVDYRVAEFFRNAWDDCLDVYNDLIAETEERLREKAEREEYARLKAKFQP